MRNRRFISILLTLCMVLSLLPTSALAAAEKFTDVPADAWYYADVDFVTEKGYFKGMSDTIFAPDETMTRAMFVTVLARYAEAKVDDTVSAFTDVPTGEWYTGAVAWAAEKGIVEGRGNGIFDPTGSATREEMCTIIARYLKVCKLDAKLVKQPAVITDMATVSSWATEAVEDCVAYGVIIGYPDGTFGPKITATRAHVAAILHRLQLIVASAGGPSGDPCEHEDAIYRAKQEAFQLDLNGTKTATLVVEKYCNDCEKVVKANANDGFTFAVAEGDAEFVSVAKNVATALKTTDKADPAVVVATKGETKVEFFITVVDSFVPGHDQHTFEYAVVPAEATLDLNGEKEVELTVTATSTCCEIAKGELADGFTFAIAEGADFVTLDGAKVTAKAVGTAKVTASKDDVVLTAVIEVIDTTIIPPVHECELQYTVEPTEVELEEGKTATLKVTAECVATEKKEDCKYVAGTEVEGVVFTSSNPAVATVDGYVVTGVAAGTAELTAAAQGLKVAVTVKAGKVVDTTDYTALAASQATAYINGYLQAALEAVGTEMVDASATYADAVITLNASATLDGAHVLKAYRKALPVAKALLDVFQNRQESSNTKGELKAIITENEDVDAIVDILEELHVYDGSLPTNREELKADAKAILAEAKEIAEGLKEKMATYKGAYPFESVTIMSGGYEIVTINAKTGLDFAAMANAGKIELQEGVKVLKNEDLTNRQKASLLKTALCEIVTALYAEANEVVDFTMPAGETDRTDAVKGAIKAFAHKLRKSLAQNNPVSDSDIVLKGSMTLAMDGVATEYCTENFTVNCTTAFNSDLVNYHYADGKDHVTVYIPEKVQTKFAEYYDYYVYAPLNDYLTDYIAAVVAGEKAPNVKDYLRTPAVVRYSYPSAQGLDTASLMETLKADVMAGMNLTTIDAVLNGNNPEALHELTFSVLDKVAEHEEVQNLLNEYELLDDLAKEYVEAESEEEQAEMIEAYNNVLVGTITSNIQEELEGTEYQLPDEVVEILVVGAMDVNLKNKIAENNPEINIEEIKGFQEVKEEKKEAATKVEAGTTESPMNQFVQDVVVNKAQEVIKEKVNQELLKKVQKALSLVNIFHEKGFDAIVDAKLSDLLPAVDMVHSFLDDKGNTTLAKVINKLDELKLYLPEDATIKIGDMTIENALLQDLRNADTTAELIDALAAIADKDVAGDLSIGYFADGADITVIAADHSFTMNLRIVVR